TAPRAEAVLAAVSAPNAEQEVHVEPSPSLAPSLVPSPEPESVAAVIEEGAEMAVELNEIEQLAETLRSAREAAPKVTILGTSTGESVTLTALTLARQLGGDARVVMVDLAASSPTISAISADPLAPGLAELMRGEASFSQVITRDRLSRVHLINAGR